MIHTMWRSVDDYMVMYLKIGQKDDTMKNNMTIMYRPVFVFQAFTGIMTHTFEAVLEVKL